MIEGLNRAAVWKDKLPRILGVRVLSFNDLSEYVDLAGQWTRLFRRFWVG